MDTKGVAGGSGGGGVMHWEIGTDIYTLICIKWMTNKNLLYTKINKIKFKNSKKTSMAHDKCSINDRYYLYLEMSSFLVLCNVDFRHSI